jgi:hypothetical protein
MPRCKFSHAEEDDPCSGNETKMYLETAIAKRQNFFPLDPQWQTLNLPAAPSLLLFSLRSHNPSPRCKNLRSILRERGGGGERPNSGAYFLSSKRSAKNPDTASQMSKLARKSQIILPLYYNLWQQKSKQTVQ